MTFSKIGRIVTALVASAALGLGMTACGGGTIGYMWVLGTYYNQISGFKIDDYTGNLTAILNSPFNSGGTDPVMLVVKPGGRFLYVVNAGTGGTGVPGSTGFKAPQGASIDEFAVGGSGELTFQNSYNTPFGNDPIYLTFDSTGNYLYVLDKYSPNYGTVTNGVTDLNGSVTAYSVASDTGELSVVANTTVLNPTTGLATYFFEVGPNPVMEKVGSGNCLYTLSPTSIYPYVVSSSTGGLTLPTTGPLNLDISPGYNGTPGSGTNYTSINTSNSGAYTFLTDGGLNEILTFQAGGTPCTLAQVSGSQETNPQTNAIPINSLTSANGKFLYVINNIIPSTTVTASSSISAFTINSLGQLQTLSDGTNNPYAVGSGPVCVVEDPSSQYLYTSNSIDSTVTGKLLDQNRGFLSDLSRGSVFPSSMNPSCLAVSGNI